MSLDVVTLGETMVLMNPVESGSLKYVTRFTKNLGGAESNFAIALARLGFKTGWISRLGNDSFGDYVEAFIRGENVDVSQVIRDPQFPTGLMVKERHELNKSRVFYYRDNSAASNMRPDDLDEEYISQARFIHLTGITPALSDGCRETVYEAIRIADKYNLKVSFDPNLRLKLWKKEEMRRVILDICKKVDILFPGLDEGGILLDKNEPRMIIEDFLELGPEIVVLKVGEKGALVGTSEFIKDVPGFKLETIIDPVGAGDGFAAGFVAGQLKNYDVVESARLANAVGAFALTVRGDVEGYPDMDELEVFLGNKKDITR